MRLVLCLGLILVGYLLIYAGLKHGNYWKHPWSPIIDVFQGKAPDPNA